MALLKDIVAAIAGKPRDYTQGSLGRAILLLSIPMVLEMAGQSLFALIDIMFVGRLGTTPVAIAVLTDQLLMFVFTIAIGLSMGTTALVARRVGEGDEEQASKTALQAILLGAALSLPIALAGLLFPGTLLGLMGGSEEVIQGGATYLRIYFGGNVTLFLLFLINAIFRGAGDPSYAMRALWMANLLNIALDPVFIFGFGPVPAYGVEGAAIATTISRGIGVLYQLWILFGGRTTIRLRFDQLAVLPGIMRRLFSISSIAILQFFISTMSFLFIARIVAKFGDTALAGYGIAIRLLAFVLLPVWGVGNAAATLVGQSLGADQPDRAEKSVWITSGVNTIFLVIVGVLFQLFSVEIAGFLHQDADVVAIAAEGLRVISYSYLFWGLGMTIVMAFNGAGDTWTPTKINFFVYWAVQIPLAWWLGRTMGWVGVFWAAAGCQALLAIVGVWAFRRGTWKTRQV